MDLVHIWYDVRKMPTIFLNTIPTLTHGLKVKWKVMDLRILQFLRPLFAKDFMDLVHMRYDESYWTKVFLSTIPSPTYDLKVKVTDLSLPHFFQNIGWIWFIYDMMINTGLKLF